MSMQIGQDEKYGGVMFESATYWDLLTRQMQNAQMGHIPHLSVRQKEQSNAFNFIIVSYSCAIQTVLEEK